MPGYKASISGIMLRLSRNHNRDDGNRTRTPIRPVSMLLLAMIGSAGVSWPADGAGIVTGETLTRGRYLMGTVLTISVPGSAGERPIEAAFDEVARLEEVMSNWRETSEISRLNEARPGYPVRCSEELFDAIVAALRWAEETAGAFDPTVEPLVQLLGLRRDGTPTRVTAHGAAADPTMGNPRSTVVDRRALAVGFHHVVLDPVSRTVLYDTPGAGIDLGGIGKGIALDAALRVLKMEGVDSALLDFGGQILASGSGPEGRGWPVGIADPDDRSAPVARVTIHDASLATSGNGERSVATATGTIGHIIDPAGGASAPFRGTVTVGADNATAADALSTALFVMGPENGIRWAEERGVAALYLMRREGELERDASRAFMDLMSSSSNSRSGSGSSGG